MIVSLQARATSSPCYSASARRPPPSCSSLNRFCAPLAIKNPSLISPVIRRPRLCKYALEINIQYSCCSSRYFLRSSFFSFSFCARFSRKFFALLNNSANFLSLVTFFSIPAHLFVLMREYRIILSLRKGRWPAQSCEAQACHERLPSNQPMLLDSPCEKISRGSDFGSHRLPSESFLGSGTGQESPVRSWPLVEPKPVTPSVCLGRPHHFRSFPDQHHWVRSHHRRPRRLAPIPLARGSPGLHQASEYVQRSVG